MSSTVKPAKDLTVPEILETMHRINVENVRAQEEEIEARIQAREEARRKKQEEDREFITNVLSFIGIDDEAIERLRKRGEENERLTKKKLEKERLERLEALVRLEKGGSLIMFR